MILCSVVRTGFTFSFPMVHESVKRGILLKWTINFTCPDGVGEDVVKMLEDAIARRGVSLDCEIFNKLKDRH